MVAVRISPFGGMVPAVDDTLLAPINAALSQDAWTYSGTLMGLPQRKLLYTMVGASTKKVYRLPIDLTDSLHLTDAIWLEFSDANTDVLRSQVVDDTFDRYYWASPSDVPRYMTLAQITASVPALAGAYILGIPQPGNIAGTVAGGTSTTLKSVAYVQTFVSAFGEEGQPSNPFIFTAQKVDATYTITLAPADPGDMGTNRNLTHKNIYRTITATNGVTTFFFVGQVSITTTTFVDNATVNTDAVIALNAEIESTNWQGPPSDLQGFVSLGNGMVAGFRQNEIWFCEPFRLHAWPAIYVLVVEYPIVGLGVQNQSLVVCTDGYAYTCVGINPASMSLQQIAGLMPCTSRGSILSTVEGVFFATPSGLALVSAAGVVIATQTLIRKDKWNALVSLNTLRAAQLGTAYYAFGQAIQGVFDTAFEVDAFQQDDFAGARNGLLLDVTNQTVAFNTLTTVDPITNIMTDVWSGEVFVIQDGQVQWLDISDVQQQRNTYVWRSKLFEALNKKNFQVAKIYFRIPPNTPAQNPVADTDQNQLTGSLQTGQYGLFRVYADSNLVMVRELRTSGEAFRLPSGFRADFWQFEIEGRVEITNLQIATSPAELATV
jgi:hypothetical protein